MISIAILGFGTVGSGVANVLRLNPAEVTAAAGEEIALKYIVDVRDFPDSPFSNCLTRDFSVVEKDPTVRVVVETIGGCGVALDFTRRALTAGKHVVTSNKQLVAEHGAELLRLAAEHRVSYLFEASVGGGIPVLRPLFSDLKANRILGFRGILNGTTNYILTAMCNRPVSFEAALQEAQKLGFAEANPVSDIEGLDAVRKLCILADLIWGKELKPEAVPLTGIANLPEQDLTNIAALGGKLKLICEAKQLEDGSLTAWVAPQVVLPGHMLHGVDNAFNALLVTGNILGDAMFYGTGAGSLPTASAIWGDILDAIAHEGQPRSIGWTGTAVCSAPAAVVSRWYTRTGEQWGLTEPCTEAQLPPCDCKFRVLD